MFGVDVVITPATPLARTREFNKGCIIGKCTGYTGDKFIEEVTDLSTLSSAGISSTKQLYKSVQWFLEGVSSAGGNNIGVTVAVYDAFSGETVEKESVLESWDSSTYEYNLQTSPVESVDAVYLKIGTAFVAQPTEAWTAEQDDSGLYTGKIVFSAVGGNETPWSPDGSSYMTNDDVSSGKYDVNGVHVDYTLSRFQSLLDELLEKDVNFIVLSHDCTTSGMAAANTFTRQSLLHDYMSMKLHCSAAASKGTPRQFIAALPAGVQPSASDAGFGLSQPRTFSDWKSLLGSQDVTLIAHRVATDDGEAMADPAAFMMGRVVSKTTLKQGFVLDDWTNFPQVEYYSAGDEKAWESAQVCVVTHMPNFFSGNLLTTGFTLGSGTAARIENVRCKYYIQNRLKAALLTLVASKQVYINKAGCLRIKSVIEGVIESARIRGVCDGLNEIVFPLLDAFRNPSEQSSQALISEAKSTRSIGPIEVRYNWSGNPEYITVIMTEV